MNSRLQDILARLLAFDTTSRESNLAMIDDIADYLHGFAIETQRFYDAEGRKANLYARLALRGPAALCSPATPTWCRLTASHGRFPLLPSRNAMAAATAAVAPI